jgi:mannose-1-phosphate guanylyltransferase/mannose-6-phosphate isomerase
MYPKQFIRFFDGQSSLLGATLQRIGNKAGFGEPIVVCNNDHRFLVREELAMAGLDARAILLEPVARNTAAAIAAAALTSNGGRTDTILAVLPSDHLIKDNTAFLDTMRQAAAIAEEGKIVLFGVPPTRPDTGYGYIRRGDDLQNGAYEVDSFREKPDREKAEKLVLDKAYLWNSGCFVCSTNCLISELEQFAPEVVRAAREALAGATEDLGFVRLDKAAFARAPSVSIDTALLEKTASAVVIPVDFEWSDAGTWAALWEHGPQDASRNTVEGDAVLVDTSRTLVHSERSFVATLGVDDLIIVDTPDALLVADKSRAQEVSGLVKRLVELNRKEQSQHIRSYRPWGYFETLNLGARFQVKLLHVHPGQQLSMQMHHHRSEHWIVVRGTAKVTIDGREKLVQENESVFISATQWHQLANPGKVHLEMIEVQIGTYLGEDDIVRSHDIYNRAPDETR